MRETVFYMRGQFPFGIDRGFSPNMVQDAKVVLELEPDQLKGIALELSEFSGFLDRASLRTIIASHVPNKEQSQRLTRVIAGLDEILRANEQNVEAFLSRMQEWLQSEENRERNFLSQDQFEELRRRLPLVLKRYPALDLQAKAQRLSEATGLPLEDVQIICDLRPVFDDRRTEVQGIIPYTILKVVCKGVDGLPVSLEAILTHRQVSELAKKATAAEKKLRTIGELLAEKGLSVPSVDLTKREE